MGKSNGTNDCILGTRSMQFTASIGNIRRLSSYVLIAHQGLSLPTLCAYPSRPAIDACIYPYCAANEAQVGERAERSASRTLNPTLHGANCSSQSALPAQLSASSRRYPHPLYLALSALAEPHSLCPFWISKWGGPLSAWSSNGRVISRACQVSPGLWATTCDTSTSDCSASFKKELFCIALDCPQHCLVRISAHASEVGGRGPAIIISASRNS